MMKGDFILGDLQVLYYIGHLKLPNLINKGYPNKLKILTQRVVNK